MPSCNENISVITAPINHNNIEALKMLNAKTFPVKYNQKFYDRVLATPSDLSMVAYFKETIIGAISCRIEEKHGVKQLYIMTLGVLAAYRRRNVGTFLLEKVISTIQTKPCYKDVKAIYLHVQINNDSAVAFYGKKDFHVEETLKDYYKHVTPSDCLVLRRHFTKAISLE